MSDRVFYVGARPQSDENRITGYFPAKFLTVTDCAGSIATTRCSRGSCKRQRQAGIAIVSPGAMGRF